MTRMLLALLTVVFVGSAPGLAAAQVRPSDSAPALASGPGTLSVAPLPASSEASPPPPPPALLVDPTLNSATASNGATAPVFGTQLFSGAFSAARPTKSSNYLLQPGDQVAVRIYGAINVDGVQTVDSDGQLFIQGIGPVQVGGAPASQLQSRLSDALGAVYNDEVGIYVDVLQGGSLGVFVTGDVRRPGRYLGSALDSVLYYLDRAGGIDAARGSFRNVGVRRNGQTVASYDLYEFITEGRIAGFNFRDGDVIYVAPRGARVIVTGEVANEYAFEARPGARTLSGTEIVALARPSGTVSSVGVTSVRDGVSQGAYFPIAEFLTATLGGGDHVHMRSEIYTQTVTISLQGDLRGPSIIVLPRGARLSDLLARVPLAGTDIEPTYVHIERRSVALRQKAALDAALDNLEQAALTTPTLSAESAQLASQQASLISQFVQRARLVQPLGKVAVYVDSEFHDVQLEDGDRVIFPRRTDVVIVAGQVFNPGAFAHARGLRVRDYIQRAGGYLANADRRHFALRRPDGSAAVVSGDAAPRPGDEIAVVPGSPNRAFILFKDLTQIIFQIAATAAVVVR